MILSGKASFGVRLEALGSTLSWATNLPAEVAASTNRATLAWTPIATNLLAGGLTYVTDPAWAQHPTRVYRVRSQ